MALNSRFNLETNVMLSTTLLRPLLAILCGVLLLLSSSVAAQNPTQSISVAATESTDLEIEKRLAQIFEEIDGLDGVVANSEAGVVTLEGDVLRASLATQAEQLATAVVGVVTVQNELRRDNSLVQQVNPLIDRLESIGKSALVSLPIALLAILIVSLFWWFGGWLSRTLYLPKALRPNPFVAELVRLLVRLFFTLIGFLLAAEILEATALLASVLGGLGVVGLALGFAIRDTIENFVASVLLSIRQPFGVNEHVAIDGHHGRIIRLTSRATIMLDFSGNHIRIPNSVVYKSTIVNYSRNPKRRFDFDVGIDSGFDPGVAQELAVNAVSDIQGVLSDPKPTCVVQELGDSNVVLRIHAWVNQNDVSFSKTRSAGMSAVKRAFEDADIDMPEPIYRLRVENVDVGGVKASLPAAKRTHDVPVSPDLTPDVAIVEQIHEDRDGDDLLSDSAMRE